MATPWRTHVARRQSELVSRCCYGHSGLRDLTLKNTRYSVPICWVKQDLKILLSNTPRSAPRLGAHIVVRKPLSHIGKQNSDDGCCSEIIPPWGAGSPLSKNGSPTRFEKPSPHLIRRSIPASLGAARRITSRRPVPANELPECFGSLRRRNFRAGFGHNFTRGYRARSGWGRGPLRSSRLTAAAWALGSGASRSGQRLYQSRVDIFPYHQ